MRHHGGAPVMNFLEASRSHRLRTPDRHNLKVSSSQLIVFFTLSPAYHTTNQTSTPDHTDSEIHPLTLSGEASGLNVYKKISEHFY